MHATFEPAGAVLSDCQVRMIMPCQLIRLAPSDVPAIDQQMDGYSAIATGRATPDVMPEFGVCEAELSRFAACQRPLSIRILLAFSGTGAVGHQPGAPDSPVRRSRPAATAAPSPH